MKCRTAFFAALVAASALNAQVPDAALATGSKLAPFVVALKPGVQMSPLPPWMPSPPTVHPETATIEVPVPALWAVPNGEFYVLTVVFDDQGDGGPAVEWRAPEGAVETLSLGLGEPGIRLGLNARTILLPKRLTRSGGVLLVSYYGRFEALISLSLRPARGDLLAVLGAQTTPAIVDDALRVFERDDVSGLRAAPITGDVKRGTIVEAELAANVEELPDAIEFIAPMDGRVEGAMLKLEVLGLDPEAHLDIELNGTPVGPVGLAGFALDDPAVVPDGLGRLTVAGWRKGTLFLPARLWSPGDNSLVVTLRRSEFESGRPVFLKNTTLSVRFSGPAPTPSVEASIPDEPDFTLPDPNVPDPAEPPLPEIVTGNAVMPR